MERKTFKNESSLPSLPVPDINETLDSYQTSQKAILSPDDYEQFLKVLENFKSSGQAQKCQESFIHKFNLNKDSYSKTGANWLEKLHEDKAYLEFRGPLYYLNIFGTRLIAFVKLKYRVCLHGMVGLVVGQKTYHRGGRSEILNENPTVCRHQFQGLK